MLIPGLVASSEHHASGPVGEYCGYNGTDLGYSFGEDYGQVSLAQCFQTSYDLQTVVGLKVWIAPEITDLGYPSSFALLSDTNGGAADTRPFGVLTGWWEPADSDEGWYQGSGWNTFHCPEEMQYVVAADTRYWVVWNSKGLYSYFNGLYTVDDYAGTDPNGPGLLFEGRNSGLSQNKFWYGQADPTNEATGWDTFNNPSYGIDVILRGA